MEMSQAVAIFNTLFLVMLYMVLIVLVVTHVNNRSNRKGGGRNNDNDNSGDGGWDNSDTTPPLDLPPGVFILPPDERDPSLTIRRREADSLV
jgi:hypothetical protein